MKGGWLTAALFVACALFCFAFRFAICVDDVAKVKAAVGVDFAPFQVESAVAYAQVRAFAAGRDEAGVLATAGVADLGAEAQLSSGMERFLGASLALKRWISGSPEIDPEHSRWEDNPADAWWVRISLIFWIAWLPGWIFLWLKWGGVSRPWALIGALFYAVMPAAVARYTGFGLLKGAFAMPFVVAWLAFWALALRDGRRRWLAPAALLAFLAAANWDMAQIVLGAWAGCEIVRRLAGGAADAQRARLLIASWVGIVLAAALLPYGRAHASLASPVALLLYPWAIFLNGRAWRWPWKWAVGAALAGLWLGAAHLSPFAGNYSHFSELIAAKLRFWNVKPADPDVLTFTQRFLWTPNLQSATWATVWSYFPLALWAAIAGTLLGSGFKNWRREAWANARQWLPCAGLAAGFFIVFIYMVRFYELAAIFVAPWLAWVGWLWWGFLRRFWARALLAAALAAVLAVEAAAILPGGVFVHEEQRKAETPLLLQAQAVEAARAARLAGQVVVADLELGSLLAGYAGCALVVQPKFELPEVRRAAEEYVTLLYRGSEEEFADFCERHQARFVFFRRDSSRHNLNPNGYRYMAAAKQIPRNAVVRFFDAAPHRLTRFRQLELPLDTDPGTDDQLRIFRYVTAADRRTAAEMAGLAWQARSAGDLPGAAAWIRSAYRIDPISSGIYELYFEILGAPPPPAGFD